MNDVDENFLKDVSLWSVVGHAKSVSRLRVLCDYYLNSRSESMKARISHVMLVGRRGSGRTVLAHAYANSLGCSDVYEAEGSTLSLGGQDISAFLQQGDIFSGYLIHNAERLSAYCASVVVPILRDNILVVRDPFNRTETSKEPFNRLLMLSCSDVGRLNQGIFRNVDEICPAEDFNDVEMLRIVNQRLDYMKWHLTDREEIVKTVVDLSNGDVSLAVRILGWSYKCAKSVGQDSVEVKHLNMALHLLQ
jgi:Holliday junction resolvasome RuvABC ATP-dependent DNA helicase subunit